MEKNEMIKYHEKEEINELSTFFNDNYIDNENQSNLKENNKLGKLHTFLYVNGKPLIIIGPDCNNNLFNKGHIVYL